MRDDYPHPIRVNKYSFGGDMTWWMTCAICDWSMPPTFATWAEAMAAAQECIRRHRERMCLVCGRTD